jgi:hypothetical protein
MKIARLAVGFIFDHAGNAAWAAEVAALTSSRDADDDCHISSCELGDVTEKVVLVVTSEPLMRRGTVYDGSGETVFLSVMLLVVTFEFVEVTSGYLWK